MATLQVRSSSIPRRQWLDIKWHGSTSSTPLIHIATNPRGHELKYMGEERWASVLGRRDLDTTLTSTSHLRTMRAWEAKASPLNPRAIFTHIPIRKLL